MRANIIDFLKNPTLQNIVYFGGWDGVAPWGRHQHREVPVDEGAEGVAVGVDVLGSDRTLLTTEEGGALEGV